MSLAQLSPSLYLLFDISAPRSALPGAQWQTCKLQRWLLPYPSHISQGLYILLVQFNRDGEQSNSRIILRPNSSKQVVKS